MIISDVQQGLTYTISCSPDPSCINRGGYTGLYLTTYVYSSVNPQVRMNSSGVAVDQTLGQMVMEIGEMPRLIISPIHILFGHVSSMHSTYLLGTGFY